MAIDVLTTFDSAELRATVTAAAGVLRDGGLVILPTETVYGVAGRIDQAATRERLSRLRGGQAGQAWTPHLLGSADVWSFVDRTPFRQRVVRKLCPGAVGLIFDVPLDARAATCERLAAEEADLFSDGRITLRVPDDDLFAAVVREAGVTVALTKLGGVTSRLPANLAEQQIDIDLAVDAGPTRFSKPSTLLRVGEDDYEIVREGVYDRRIIERKLLTTILFVCSGNTCRSPMAEALLRMALSKRIGVSPDRLEAEGYSVMSAGVHAMNGTRATPQGLTAVELLGADLSRHRSSALTIEMLHLADRVYTMGQSHARSIISVSPMAADKIRPLDPQADIDDPIGADVETYSFLATKMLELIQNRVMPDLLEQTS